MKTRTFSSARALGAFIYATLLLLWHLSPALAAEVPIFSNEQQELNSNTIVLDFDDTQGNVTLQFGKTLAEQLYWDDAIERFVFTDDLQVQGNIEVDGVIIAGTGDTQITTATGSLDGNALENGSVTGNALANNTITTDQINLARDGAGGNLDARDIELDATLLDNATASDVESALDELDAAITVASQDPTGTQSNTFTLDEDGTGGNVELVFGAGLGAVLRHDGTQFSFTNGVQIDGANPLRLRDGDTTLNSSVSGQLDIDATSTVDITAPQVNVNGNATISGTVNGTNLSTTGIDFQGNATVGNGANTLAIESANWDVDASGNATGLSIDGANNAISNIGSGEITNESITSADIANGAITDADISAGANIALSKLATDPLARSNHTGSQTASTISDFSDRVGDSTATLTNKTFDADGAGNSVVNLENENIKANANIDFSKLATREKSISVPMNAVTIETDGSDNLINLYTDRVSGPEEHEFYFARTTQGSVQDIDLVFQILLPEDFVSFGNANDLSLFYQNTGVDATDSKIDVTVTDSAGNIGFSSVVTDLFATNWTEYLDEFDGAGFAPSAGEYIYVRVKAYASDDGATAAIARVGELTLRYTGR